MELAYDFLWVGLIIGLIWLALLIGALVNLFRRNDLSGTAKLLWLLVLIVFPLLGLIVYLLMGRRTRHTSAL